MNIRVLDLPETGQGLCVCVNSVTQKRIEEWHLVYDLYTIIVHLYQLVHQIRQQEVHQSVCLSVCV